MRLPTFLSFQIRGMGQRVLLAWDEVLKNGRLHLGSYICILSPSIWA